MPSSDQAAFAAGTLRSAAAAARMSERTARRRWHDPRFRASVEALRSEVEAAGFQKSSQAVILEIGQKGRVDFTLGVGDYLFLPRDVVRMFGSRPAGASWAGSRCAVRA